MGRFRNPFDLGYLGNLLDFWTRARRIESNPYHYTELYLGKQVERVRVRVRVRVTNPNPNPDPNPNPNPKQSDAHPPETPASPSLSCNEDDELIGSKNDVEAGGRPAA
jgi:hypothetical protein